MTRQAPGALRGAVQRINDRPVDARGILLPPPDVVEKIARELFIVEHETGELTKWPVNAEQREFWRAVATRAWVYLLKGRQIGASTAQLLYDLLFVVYNAARGHRVYLWLLWDKEENTKAKIAQVADFAKQLGFAHRATDLDIVFPNGSMIQGFTAGSNRVGASKTCHYLHMSELPAMRDAGAAYDSVMQSLIPSGRVVIETTMLLGQALPVQLWKEPNRYLKLFLPVEMHEEYRGVPTENPRVFDVEGDNVEVTPAEEAWFRAEGFTRLDTIAYMVWLLANKIKGRDRVALLREYPQLVRHCFNLAEGRWVRCEPEVTPHESIVLDGKYLVKIYRQPADTSRQLLIAMDTSGGLGETRTVVGLFDKKDRALCAVFVDEWASYKEGVFVGKWLQDRYTYQPEQPLQILNRKPPVYPLGLIEDNGIGGSSVREAQEQGFVYAPFHQDAAKTLSCMQEAREACESGVLKGPMELSEEADSCHTKDGKFHGLKDVLMTAGIAYVYMKDDPYRDDTRPEGKQAVTQFASQLQRRKGWSQRM